MNFNSYHFQLAKKSLEIDFFLTKGYRAYLNGNSMSDTELEHSDYIVYVDESGDHSLDSINPRYPLTAQTYSDSSTV